MGTNITETKSSKQSISTASLLNARTREPRSDAIKLRFDQGGRVLLENKHSNSELPKFLRVSDEFNGGCSNGGCGEGNDSCTNGGCT